MASFENPEKPNASKPLSKDEKLPFRRIEPALHKFIQVLNVDLGRLHLHQNNMENFQSARDWEHLKKEQINASRTVKQLKAIIRQLEHTRTQVREEDFAQFDGMVADVQKRVIGAVVDFLYDQSPNEPDPLKELQALTSSLGIQTLDAEPARPLGSDVPSLQMEASGSSSEQTTSDAETTSLVGATAADDVSVTSQVQLEAQRHLDEQRNQEVEESWQDLKSDLVELNSMIHDFSSTVDSQQEVVDQIETNVETAAENVSQGAKILAEAAKYKNALFPIMGAVVGGVFGGPLGLVAGLKIGSIGAVGGGIAGMTGGHLLRVHQDEQLEQATREVEERAVGPLVEGGDGEEGPAAADEEAVDEHEGRQPLNKND